MSHESRRRWRRIALAAFTVGALSGPALALPAHAAPDPAPTAAAAPGATLSMYMWVSGSNFVAQGKLAGSRTGAALPDAPIVLSIDGEEKATATTDANGAWQVQLGLDQIPDGSHEVAAQFSGSPTDGPARMQARITTRKPPSQTELMGSFATAVAGPGDTVRAQGTLKSGGQPLPGAKLTLSLAGVTADATSDGDGAYTISAAVPAGTAVGQTLTATVAYAGDATHAPATISLPLMVQKVASPTPTPTPTPSPSVSPSASPSASASAAPTSATPGVLSAEPTQIQNPTPPKAPRVGVRAIAPFLIVSLLALAAAAGVGYWFYSHRDES